MYRFLIPAAALCLSVGFLIGATVTAWAERSDPVISLTTIESAIVPVVSITGIRDNALHGIALGGVRIVAGDTSLVPDASGSFAITNKALLTNMITVHLPDGMKFVASKKGKKYYSVTSKSGQNIVPANRVYFRTAEDAVRAGYKF